MKFETVNIMRHKYDKELPLQKIVQDTIGMAPACMDTNPYPWICFTEAAHAVMAWISLRTIIKYFSGEDRAISVKSICILQ